MTFRRRSVMFFWLIFLNFGSQYWLLAEHRLPTELLDALCVL